MQIRIIVAAIIAVLGTTTLVAQAPQPRASAGAAVVFTNAWLVDGTGAPAVANACVHVGGDRIVAVGRGTPPAVKGAQVVDLTGKSLLPGLGDMHVHLGDVEQARWMLKLLLAHGVTNVKDAGNTLGNLAGIRRWLAKTDAVPHVAISGATMNGSAENLEFLRAGPRTRALLENNLAFGVDFLKIHNWISSDGLKQIADFARANNLFLTGHVPLSMSSITAIDAGMTILEHVRVMPFEILDDPSLVAMFPLDQLVMHRTGSWHYYDPKGASATRTIAEWEKRKDKFFVDPTLAVQEALAYADDPARTQGPDLQLVSPALRQSWGRGAAQYGELKGETAVRAKGSVKGMATFITQVHAKGVRVLSGTDAPVNWTVPGVSLIRELELLVEAGLSPVDAVRTSTGRVAEALRVTDRGTVVAGKRADFVIATGNVGADIRALRHIEQVVLAGLIHQRSALLAEAARLAAEDQPAPANPPTGAGNSGR